MRTTNMAKKKIHSTKDYKMFKTMTGNRRVNRGHIFKLRKSVETYGLLPMLIFVNKQYEVIDGQHRLKILEEMGAPVYYMIFENFGLREAQIYNINDKNWNMDDWAESWAEQGHKDYDTYLHFREKYKFGSGVTRILLSGSMDTAVAKFVRGDFKVGDLEKAFELAEFLKELRNYHTVRDVTARAIIKIDKYVEGFEKSRLMQKLSYKSADLKNHSTVEDYITNIEKVYNHRARNFVDLRPALRNGVN